MPKRHVPSSLGAAIREAREHVGLTQAELARQAGFAQNYVSRLEAGMRAAPQFETIAKLAVVLGISLDTLAAACGYETQPRLPADASIAVARATQAMNRVLRNWEESEDVMRKAIGELMPITQRHTPGRPAKGRRKTKH